MIQLIIDENLLCIGPSSPALEKLLTLTEHGMTQDPANPWGGLKSFRQEVQVFNVLRDDREVGRVIQTWQGLWRKVCAFLAEQGTPFVWRDTRQPFPKPRFDLMGGFRFSQKALLEKALSQDMSGLIGAPTRYGKTVCLINTLRAYPDLTAVVTVPGADVLDQLYNAIKLAIPYREVKKLGGGSKNKYPSDDITVCSMDSLHKCDHGRVRLLLIDEPHALPTDARIEDFNQFPLARKIGFGATLKGRYDRRDMMIEGMIGPVLAERTFQEAVAEGAICQIKAILIKVPFNPPTDLGERRAIIKRMLSANPVVGEITNWICRELLPADWQTLAFIRDEAAAEFFLEHIGAEGTIAMAKRLTATARKELTARMVSGEIKRCLASDIYAQGVTFSDVKAMLNLGSGGPYTGTVQKPGRLAEIRPGKKCGVLFDFLFEPVGTDKNARGGWAGIVGEGWARHGVYQEKGYDIAIFGYQERAAIREYFERECI